MKVSEKWHITGRAGDFVLTERSVRVDGKSGKEKVSEKQTYHSSIEQCLNKIVKSESREFLSEDNELMARTATDLKVFLDAMKVDLKKIAEGASHEG